MDGRVWLDVSSGRAHSQAGEFAREGASPPVEEAVGLFLTPHSVTNVADALQPAVAAHCRRCTINVHG